MTEYFLLVCAGILYKSTKSLLQQTRGSVLEHPPAPAVNQRYSICFHKKGVSIIQLR